MPDLTRILDIAKRALMAHQNAMNIASNNIANANTEGYSRQRIQLKAGRQIITPHGIFGTGVHMAGIERIREAAQHRAHVLAVQEIEHLSPAPLGRDDPRIPQGRQMAGDAREVHAAAVRDLADSAGPVGGGEPREDRQPRRIGEGAKDLRLQMGPQDRGALGGQIEAGVAHRENTSIIAQLCKYSRR